MPITTASPFGLHTALWSTAIRVMSVGLLITGIVALFRISSHRIRQISLWKLPGPPSVSLISGNYSQMYHVGAAQFHKHIMDTYGRVIRITGPFWDTQLLISDPMACARILLKDQDIFEEAHWFIESNQHALGIGLLSTLGDQHRKQRKLLNPVFSTKQIRSLAPLFHRITHQLCDALQSQVAGGPTEVDMVVWLHRFALELIAQGGMGYTFNSLEPDAEENEFGKSVKEYTPTLSNLGVLRILFPLVSAWPKWLRRCCARLVPMPMVHNIIRLTDVMQACTQQILDEKKALLEMGDSVFAQQLSEGKDIISVLMKTNITASVEERLPDEEIRGQMATLILAATDTTSAALSRIMQLLSQRPDVQEKLRKELNLAGMRSGQSDLDYDVLVSLPYLDAICRETLRLFPPLHFVHRVTRADVSIPLSEPIKASGDPLSSLFIPSGTAVAVNIVGMNRDQSIWGADAAEWKPERWLAPLPESVVEARIPGVYANTLTFLGGERACIGFKFSQLEMKAALAQLIRAFRLSPSGTEIVWRFGLVASPSVKESTVVRAQLPMVVEMA
ncbi:cytochrome P450 [Artomyces pyxidatus]|uniref:Cytochrome P450 n=1 Tax=Artomyces pyxidatus TaxID=48021 RepID=A0ACB8SJ51_9AGAM|nr:cytochrome P450 [Artomyces pyxidatus]